MTYVSELSNVDLIFLEMLKDDDREYWTAERLEALQTIRLSPGYWENVPVALDGIPVVIRLTYNDIDFGYFIDLRAEDDSIDVKGLRLNSCMDVLDGLAISELGRLFVVDLEQEIIDPTYEGLGTRFVLMYLPKAYK